MNCSYRILEEGIHIGLRVRKTKDKTTVPFDNKPMKDMKLENYDKLGFYLSHPSLPKRIWVDFDQLPLKTLNIERGVIKDELTFVEEVADFGVMKLVRTETFDYLELLDDLNKKKESKRYKLATLSIGDTVVSCICRNSLKMIYLGTFNVHNYTKRSYNSGGGYYSRHRSNEESKRYIFPDNVLRRAFFMFPSEDGKSFAIKSYPTSNKYILELYKHEDVKEVRFEDQKTNSDILTKAIHKHAGYTIKDDSPNAISINTDQFTISDYELKSAMYVSSKKGSVEEMVQYAKDNIATHADSYWSSEHGKYVNREVEYTVIKSVEEFNGLTRR